MAFGAIGIVVVGGVVAVWFLSSLSIDQRIATLGVVLTFGALLLAALAAIVAIAAYLFAQRRPQLGVGLVTSDPVASRDGSATITISITPNVNNVGTATATNAKVTLSFFGATVILANYWQPLGDTMMWYEIPTLHVDPTIPNVLPSIVVRIASDNHEARLSWQTVADRSHNSGSYLLNRPR